MNDWIKLGHWIFPALRDSATAERILDILFRLLILSTVFCLLSTVSRLFHLDIGYSPALRDPAGRDGLLDIESLAVKPSTWTLDIPCWLLDIEYLAVMLDIGYSSSFAGRVIGYSY